MSVTPMRYRASVRWLAMIWILHACVGSAGEPDLLDDRDIPVGSRRELRALRTRLIQYIWGQPELPRERVPDVVTTNVPSPIRHLRGLARVDRFRTTLAEDLEGLAYHFIPEKPNRQLVVVHHGHACTMDDEPGPADIGYGLQRTVDRLLMEGYGVLGVFMPRMRPGDCTGGHEKLFEKTPVGSPMRYFLEPTLTGLNHLVRESGRGGHPKYKAYHMTGLSGGGWTTTVYAALDPRIRCSVPIAGTLPLYLRSGGSVGDLEQFEPGFYGIAGYPTLYVLGSSGKGRSQVQVLVRRDDCCFGERQHDASRAGVGYGQSLRDYEKRVQGRLHEVGSGQFRVEVDETAPSHMISHWTIEEILLPTLRGRR